MGNHVHVAIHFLAITSLQRYAHATAAQMSCYCGIHSVSKIKFPSNLNSVGKIYLQCLPSLTRSSLTRSSWQSGNRLVNALPGDVTIRTADPGWLMKTSGVRRFGVQFPASFGRRNPSRACAHRLKGIYGSSLLTRKIRHFIGFHLCYRGKSNQNIALAWLGADAKLVPLGKKRKKAARGVRFKSRLTPNMFRSRPSHSRLPLFHWYFCVSSCSFANISVGLLMWILYAFGTLEIEMSCYKIWSAKTLHALLCWVNYLFAYRCWISPTDINWTSNPVSQTGPILWSLFNFNKLPIIRSCHTPCFCFLSNKTKTFHTKFIHAKIMTMQYIRHHCDIPCNTNNG